MLEAHAAEHAAMAPTAQGLATLRAACEAGEAAMPGAVMRAHVEAGKAVFLAAAAQTGQEAA
ncbi:MAG: hypothetical protein FJX32_15290 [Alphaproteobacteria bacterium]|nr:hypothetical protein [Alphaproteobacteria bacterium]